MPSAVIAGSSSPTSVPTSAKTNAAHESALTHAGRLGERLTTPITRPASSDARKPADACRSQSASDAAWRLGESTAEMMQTCIAARSVFLTHATQAITPGTQRISEKLYGIGSGHTHLHQA
jgi:hypothetical protein